MAIGNGVPQYRVYYPPELQDRFQQLADRAVAIGRLAEWGTFLLQMADRLVTDPMGWADSIRSTPGRPGVVTCWRYTRLVGVEYTVSDLDRRVRVTRVLLPPGSPLA